MNTSWVLFWIASTTFFMQSVDTTMVYTAIPAIAQSLRQPVLHMETIVISYIVTVVAFTPANSWLAERLGERKTYQIAIATFTLGSLLCMTATTLGSLSVYRFIQGIGGALMLPIIRTVILRTTPQSLKLRFLNRVTLLGLLGTLLGPVLGNILVSFLSWQAIFLVNIPLAFICFFLASKYIPVAAINETSRTGAYEVAFPILMLFLIAFMLTSATKNILPTFVMLFLSCSTLGLVFLYYRQHLIAETALFPRALFSIRTFSVGIIGGIATRTLLASTPIVLSLTLQTTLACQPAETSLILLIFSSGALLSKLLFEPLVKRIGYRRLLMLSTSVTSLCVLALSAAVQERAMPFIGIIVMLLGVLISTLYSAESTLAFSNLNNSTYHSGNNLLTISQLLSVMLSMTLTFPILRFLSQFEVLFNLNPFSLLFLLLGLGLPMCCLIFRPLNNNDGYHFIHGR